MDSCTKEVAKEMLHSLRSNTPVQKGTLRRGWTTKSLQRAGDTHRIEIINPVSYATYVEYGHRTPDHRKWVKGRLMMTRSEREINRMAPAIVEKEMKKYLGDLWK